MLIDAIHENNEQENDHNINDFDLDPPHDWAIDDYAPFDRGNGSGNEQEAEDLDFIEDMDEESDHSNQVDDIDEESKVEHYYSHSDSSLSPDFDLYYIHNIPSIGICNHEISI
jgi:hypothetical protein